jgi:uncharacterized protein (TIGR02271 family)
MFDSRSEAEAARERLTQSVGAQDVQILDKSSSGSSGETGSNGDGGGLWSSIKNAFMAPDDRQSYEEGVRRGGYLVCARVEEDQADEACRLLDQGGSIDFDERERQWRSEGWSGQAETGARGYGQQERATIEEERIPIVEEELRVGKREVERGSARVRSYVEERPVSEQVTLREENVSIERRPVDQPIESGDLDRNNLLQDREIEMTERSEEAVVDKEARVTEEVVLRKSAEERTEQIEDTVRRTDVEVDQSGGERGRPAFGFDQGRPEGSAAERQERQDLESGDQRRR